jgi:hypothetical protein
MSEAVLIALERKLPYKQTGIDDLESVVWVLYWFFHHFKPRKFGDGWDAVQYAQDVASQTTVNRAVLPATAQSSLRPPSAAEPSAGGQGSHPSSQPGQPPSRKRRSPFASGGDGSNKKACPSPSRLEDPLEVWFSKRETAHDNKSNIKYNGVEKPFEHWNSSRLISFFDNIWLLPEWACLSGIGLRRFDRRRPNHIPESSFATLVQKLSGQFNQAADDVRDFYPI